MRFAIWIGLLAAAVEHDRAGPLAWSPDGKWLAYVQEDRPSAELPRPGWLFEAGADEGGAARAGARVRSYKLWTTRPGTLDSVLLEDSRGPLSAPAWSRDGTSLAFGRVAVDTDGGSAWEVLVQDAPDRRRVLLRQPLTHPIPGGSAIGLLAPSWSPDGRMLAVPRLQPPGLVIVRADSGRVVRSLDGASRPEWSPVDNRLAYYATGPVPALTLLDGVLTEPRTLATLTGDVDVLPAPVWSRDAQTLMILRRTAPREAAGAARRAGPVFQLARYRSDGAQIEAPIELTHDPIGPEGTLAGVWFALGSDGESAFYATATGGQASAQATWSLGKFDVVHDRFNPYDEASLVGALAPSPTGHLLALRVGSDGGWSPPGVYNLDTKALALLAPDASAGEDWLARTLDATRTLLRDRLPSPTMADGTPCERPSLLPAPGELEPGDPLAFRLRKLGRFGLTVLGPPSPETDEARLAFAYLSGDAQEAARVVERLLAGAETADRRFRLREVQAQVLLLRKDFNGAAPLIAHLRAASTGPSHQVEDDLSGRGITKVNAPFAPWPAFLQERAAVLRKPAAADASPDLVPRNALDLENLRGGVPVPFP